MVFWLCHWARAWCINKHDVGPHRALCRITRTYPAIAHVMRYPSEHVGEEYGLPEGMVLKGLRSVRWVTARVESAMLGGCMVVHPCNNGKDSNIVGEVCSMESFADSEVHWKYREVIKNGNRFLNGNTSALVKARMLVLILTRYSNFP